MFHFYTIYRLPDWANEVLSDKEMQYIHNLFYTLQTYTPTMAKLSTGFLIKEMLDRATLKSQSKLTPDYSMYVYSGHDTNIANVLNSLGLYSLDVRIL